MLPKDPKKLEQVRAECRKMVLGRAATSAGAAVIPLPGLDMAADAGLLMRLLPAINRKFGLSAEQIDEMDPRQKALVYALIKCGGKTLVGRVITKEIVVTVLKRVGVQMTARQATKYVPIAGQVASAFIGFGAMMYIGASHVDECYRIARESLDQEPKEQ